VWIERSLVLADCFGVMTLTTQAQLRPERPELPNFYHRSNLPSQARGETSDPPSTASGLLPAVIAFAIESSVPRPPPICSPSVSHETDAND